MSLFLFAYNPFPLSEVAAILQSEGIETTPMSLNLTGNKPVKDRIAKAALMVRESGVVDIGDRANKVRQMIGEQASLWVCAPTLNETDRQRVFQCGATEVFSPSGWSVTQVAERILGELIKQGELAQTSCGSLYGATLCMRNLYNQIERFAGLEDPVLILGETGTGKELIARALHDHSQRNKGPLVKVNCASVPRELFESEFFGHVKGSFSGAVRDRLGRFQAADGGTLFLDEVGEIPMDLQSKLLRVLQEGEFERVGDDSPTKVDVRIIAATNRDLHNEIAAGRFREDLFYRLCIFPVMVPPLRERLADIPLLVNHLIADYCQAQNVKPQVATHTLDCLFEYDWPGNVRDLNNVIKRAVAFSRQSESVSVVALNEALQQSQVTRLRLTQTAPEKGLTVAFDPATDNWALIQQRMQSAYFRALLEHTGGNREEAIRLSGLGHSRFYEILRKLGQAEENTKGE